VNLREKTAWASQLRAFGADAVSNTIFFHFPQAAKIRAACVQYVLLYLYTV